MLENQDLIRPKNPQPYFVGSIRKLSLSISARKFFTFWLKKKKLFTWSYDSSVVCESNPCPAEPEYVLPFQIV